MRAAYRMMIAALAFLGLIGAAAVVPPPAFAADLPVATASPGTLYRLGPFERRGVAILEGATVEIRADGCWRTDMLAVNGNPAPVTVSISYRWHDRRGRTIATIGAISREVLAPAARTNLSASGCSGAIARNYGTLSRTAVVRVMSVRP